METRKRVDYARAVYFAAVALAVALGGAYFNSRYRLQVRRQVEAQISAWREGPRLTAELLIERYGLPDSFASGTATWYERGVWKRMAVHGDQPYSYFEQAVGYRARPEAAAALREFDHGVRLDLGKRELSATSNREALNFLALNMADEVAAGKRRAKDAREFYVRAAELAVAGKSSPYRERLLFEPYRPEPRMRWNGKEMGY